MKTGTLTVLSLIFSLMLHAQSWQWGKRGGSAFDGFNVDPAEQVVDMATDKWGNVYTFSVLESSGSPTLGTTALQGYGGRDMVLASFKCDGTLRWKKVIGGGQDADRPKALRIDTFGHIFITGIALGGVQTTHPAVHFDTDTTLPYSNVKSIFIAQYDTSGTFKWLRQPEPDTATITSAYNFLPFDAEIDNQGNAYLLAYMGSGLIGGSTFSITTPGPYVLKYSAQGSLVAVITPQMSFGQVPFNSFRMARTASGKFVITGQLIVTPFTPSTFYLNGQLVTHSLFAACFDPQWQLLWKKEGDDSDGAARYRPVIDAQNNIYIAGNAAEGKTFNGYTFQSNTAVSPVMQPSVPFVMKMDSAGNKIWATNAYTNGTSFGSGLTLAGSELVITGSYPGKLVWPGYVPVLSHTVNQGYDVFVTRLHAQTGAVTGMDSIGGNFGNNDFATAITSDKAGSVYIGGQFASQITVAGTTLNNAGGAYDFFVAKYGYTCNCIAPVAGFNSVATAVKTVQFTYTGTATAIDSLVWDFGDGQRQKITSGYTNPISHTYTVTGHYTAGATVYSSCGSNTYAKSYALSVGGINGPEGVKVYPNPAGDYLMIEGAAGSTAILTNTVGQQAGIFSITADQQRLPLTGLGLSSGVYILTVQSLDGVRATVRITK